MSVPSVPSVTIATRIARPIGRVWELFTGPEHIVQWNFATSDWHCPSAINDVRAGGAFNWRMESKDGRMGFNLSGKYTDVVPGKKIAYEREDGRQSFVEFDEEKGKTRVSVTFRPETTNPVDLQRSGWQAILDNFCRYAEQRG